MSEREATASAADLALCETASAASGVAPDGTVVLDLIRPCVGRGRGRHLYEAGMLEKHAHVFEGWRMFVDHQAPEARKKAGGLPRSLRDLGGRITESWWDPTVPAEPAKGFGAGAVKGRARPTPFVRELIENDSEIVQVSINANATGVRPTIVNGERVMLVEGIEPRGSVDWVTEAGAGGRVVALMEAHMHDDPDEVLSALAEADDDDEYDEDDKAEIDRYMAKGMPRKLAVRACKAKKAARAKKVAEATEEDDDVNSDQIVEALASNQGQQLLRALVEEAVQDALAESVEGTLRPLIEAAIEDERDLIRAEASVDTQREIQLRDLRDQAYNVISESRLPAPFQARLRERFALTEAGPTADLDVVDEYDEQGRLVTPAWYTLQESLQDALAESRELLAAANPTRVSGQGGGTGTGPNDKPVIHSPLTKQVLQEAGFTEEDVEQMHGYAITG